MGRWVRHMASVRDVVGGYSKGPVSDQYVSYIANQKCPLKHILPVYNHGLRVSTSTNATF